MKYEFNTFRKSGGAKYIVGPLMFKVWGGGGKDPQATPVPTPMIYTYIYQIKTIYRECIARCDFVHRLYKAYIFQRVN